MFHLNATYASGIDNYEANPFSLCPSQAELLGCISVLQSLCDGEMIAWLAFARKGGFNYWPAIGRLSKEQVLAISALSEYEDSLVLDWLRDGRSKAQSG